MSVRFDMTQLSWVLLEKEAYKAMTTLDCMHWLAPMPDRCNYYTDHSNVIFLFDPLAVVKAIFHSSSRKVL